MGYSVAILFRNILSMIAVAVLASACSRYALPPPVSMSKFVRDPSIEELNGKVAFTSTMGVMVLTDRDEESKNTEPMPPFFGSEGALSVWLGEHYDLTLSVHSALLMALEGNLVYATDEYRLGFIHGVGMAIGGTLWESVENFDGDLFYNLSAGFMAQVRVQPMNTFFLGLRYTYASWEQFGSELEELAPEPTHYISGAIGFTWSSGSFRSTIELMVHYGHSWFDVMGGGVTSDVVIILPSFTFAAEY